MTGILERLRGFLGVTLEELLASPRLTDHERRILTCRLIDGKTLKQTGIEVGHKRDDSRSASYRVLSRERTRQIQARATKKLLQEHGIVWLPTSG